MSDSPVLPSNDSVINMPEHCDSCGSPVVKAIAYCSACGNRFGKDVFKQICSLFLKDKEKELSDKEGYFAFLGCFLWLITPFIVYLSANYFIKNMLISIVITVIISIIAFVLVIKLDERHQDKIFDREIALKIHRFLGENHLSLDELLYIGSDTLKSNSGILRGLRRLNDKSK